MKKIKLSILGAAMACLNLVGGSAQAAVITFDEASLNPFVFSGLDFSVGGLSFTNMASFSFHSVWDASSPNSNGTRNYIFTASSGFTSITKTGGGTFNVQSIDFAISFNNSNPSETIFINGNPLTITQTLTTYTLNLNGISALNITPVASLTGFWLADNVAFTTGGVPETSTWIMMLLGFAGLGLAGYRKAKSASAIAA